MKIAQWDAFRSNDANRPPTLLDKSPEGRMHLGDVRWGFKENGTDTKQWQPIYKDATVDPHDVKDVFIAVEPFAPRNFGGGHGYAVMEFNKPVTTSDGQKDNRIYVSIEAWMEKGDKFGLLKGLEKRFGVVHQVGSFSDRVQRQARKEGNSLILHRLNLTPEQREEFVRNSLDDAVKDRTGEYYNTVFNSCFETQVVELNKVLPQDRRLHRWTQLLHLPRMATVLPGLAGVVLQRAGLRTPDRPIEIHPDAQLYPDKAVRHQGVLALSTQHPWFGASCRLAGAALVGGVGSHYAGIAGAIAGALVGNFVAGIGADQAKVLNGTVWESPERYYQAPR